MKAGDVFWFETNSLVGLHLTFVLTDPDPRDGKVVIVHATDQAGCLDWTTVLMPGDHPRITKRSVIRNKATRIIDHKYLESEVEHSRASKVEGCDLKLLTRIRDGVIQSEEADEEVEEYCHDNFPKG